MSFPNVQQCLGAIVVFVPEKSGCILFWIPLDENSRGSSFHKVGVITPVKSHEHVTRFAHVIHM